MPISIHTQKTEQKKSVLTAASVLDSSSQNESLQRKADIVNNTTQRAEAPRPNNTGMPDNLKSGIESLSGFSMDDVRVHYNSSKPATVQALAYTQGTDIHVAPGQEKHLPHEAWHVTQQMAGRVSPTTNINGMPVNDNAALEHEADVMGEKAVAQRKNCTQLKTKKNTTETIQCAFDNNSLRKINSQAVNAYEDEKGTHVCNIISRSNAFAPIHILHCSASKFDPSSSSPTKGKAKSDFKKTGYYTTIFYSEGNNIIYAIGTHTSSISYVILDVDNTAPHNPFNEGDDVNLPKDNVFV